MEHVHYLHSQHYHDTSARFAEGGCYTKFQFFTAIDHILHHVIDRVLMHAGTLGDDLSHLETHLEKKTRGTLSMLMMWIVGDDATQIAIVNRGPFEVVTLALATIVIAQGEAQCR
jgi:hypothetical protein